MMNRSIHPPAVVRNAFLLTSVTLLFGLCSMCAAASGNSNGIGIGTSSPLDVPVPSAPSSLSSGLATATDGGQVESDSSSSILSNNNNNRDSLPASSSDHLDAFNNDATATTVVDAPAMPSSILLHSNANTAAVAPSVTDGMLRHNNNNNLSSATLPRLRSILGGARAHPIFSGVHKRLATAASKTPAPSPIRLSVPVAAGLGILLAFNSGYLNGCCMSGLLLSPHFVKPQPVAAVTGAYTFSALGFASSSGNRFRNAQFQNQISMILSYFGGSTVASLLNPRPVPFQVALTAGPTLVLGAALLYGASQFAVTFINNSGNNNNMLSTSPFVVFALIAAANGLQNSLTSVHTSNMIRSAHFSGITSDTGTFLGQVMRGNKQNLDRLYINAALAVAFWTGSALSWSATQSWSISCLFLSATLYLAIAVGLMAVQFL